MEKAINILCDMVLAADCVAMTIVVTRMVFRLPQKLLNIDLSKNKKNKPIGKYVENASLLIFLRIVLVTVVFFAVALIALLCGRIPLGKDLSGGALIAVPILFILLGTIAGMIGLGTFYLRTVKKGEYWTPAPNILVSRSRTKAAMGVGLLISFYFCLSYAFLMFDLLVLCGYMA